MPRLSTSMTHQGRISAVKYLTAAQYLVTIKAKRKFWHNMVLILAGIACMAAAAMTRGYWVNRPGIIWMSVPAGLLTLTWVVLVISGISKFQDLAVDREELAAIGNARFTLLRFDNSDDAAISTLLSRVTALGLSLSDRQLLVELQKNIRLPAEDTVTVCPKCGTILVAKESPWNRSSKVLHCGRCSDYVLFGQEVPGFAAMVQRSEQAAAERAAEPSEGMSELTAFWPVGP